MTRERESSTSLAPGFPLSVLLVEDNPADAELCLHTLDKSQFEIQCDVVTTADEFVRKLKQTTYDVILSDYNLGHWTGMDALELLRRVGYDIPLILVTAALGDQTAVECVERGVADYVLKGRLDRLPAVISKVLEEKGRRCERQSADRSLKENEAKFRALAEAIPTAVFIEQGTQCRYVNRAAERITGYPREELFSMNFWSLILPSSRKALMQEAANRTNDDEQSAGRYETRIVTKTGQVRWLDVSVGALRMDGKLAALISAADITERKRRELRIPEPETTHLLPGCPHAGEPAARVRAPGADRFLP
ncbi:MAG: PAS domain S-box protein [Candidatus Acidiferrales bacterium]